MNVINFPKENGIFWAPSPFLCDSPAFKISSTSHRFPRVLASEFPSPRPSSNTVPRKITMLGRRPRILYIQGLPFILEPVRAWTHECGNNAKIRCSWCILVSRIEFRTRVSLISDRAKRCNRTGQTFMSSCAHGFRDEW